MGIGAPPPSSPDPWLPLLSNWAEYVLSALTALLLLIARSLNKRNNEILERVGSLEKKVSALETIGLVEKVGSLHSKVTSLEANYLQVDHDLKGVRQNQNSHVIEQRRLHKENREAAEASTNRFENAITELRHSINGGLTEVRRDVSSILRILVEKKD